MMNDLALAAPLISQTLKQNNHNQMHNETRPVQDKHLAKPHTKLIIYYPNYTRRLVTAW